MKILIAGDPPAFHGRDPLDSRIDLVRGPDVTTILSYIAATGPEVIILDDSLTPSAQHTCLLHLRQDSPRSPIKPVVLRINANRLTPEERLSNVAWESLLGPLAPDTVIDVAEWALSTSGHLREALNAPNMPPTSLAADDSCEWVRTSVAIVGLVRIAPTETATLLHQECSRAVDRAHGLVDRLPDDILSFEDIWNLILFLAVPWTSQDLFELRDFERVLHTWRGNTTGSRKILLPKGISPRRHVGAFEAPDGAWSPIPGDPLRQALASLAADPQESQALEVLFKKRLTESDFDHLVRILGRLSA